jgi:hypothetical protein
MKDFFAEVLEPLPTDAVIELRIGQAGTSWKVWGRIANVRKGFGTGTIADWNAEWKNMLGVEI